MRDALRHLEERLTPLMKEDGYWESPVPGVVCTKISRTDLRTKRRWQRRFAFVISGEKEIALGAKIHHCFGGIFTFTPMDLPVTSRISKGSPKRPFLAILIELDQKVLSELVREIDFEAGAGTNKTVEALFVRKAGDELIEAIGRLIKTFQSASESRVLGPQIVREILFHVLKGKEGAALCRSVRSDEKTFSISRVTHQIQSQLDQEIDIDELARLANMSRAVFFRYFKQVTTMSPIQYQKRLRLIEARRLLIELGETAESSAYKVGYKSTSQFSREYSRMFKKSPRRDALLHRGQ